MSRLRDMIFSEDVYWYSVCLFLEKETILKKMLLSKQQIFKAFQLLIKVKKCENRVHKIEDNGSFDIDKILPVGQVAKMVCMK